MVPILSGSVTTSPPGSAGGAGTAGGLTIPSAAGGCALTDAVPPSSGVVVGCGCADDDTAEDDGGELGCVGDWALVCELDGVVAGGDEGRIEGGWVGSGAGAITCVAAGSDGVGCSTRDGAGSRDAALQSR